MRHQYNRKNSKIRYIAAAVLVLLLFSIVCLTSCVFGCGKSVPQKEEAGEAAVQSTEIQEVKVQEAGVQRELVQNTEEQKKQVQKSDMPEIEERGSDADSAFTDGAENTNEIYSYLQGIKSYEKGAEWTGAWCYEEAGGQQFSQFGCGICCLSNMYSTFSKKAVDPDEMYNYARTESGYNPDSGVGAIGWSDIQTLLTKMGFQKTELYEKPDSYEEFEEAAASAETLLVLVSSNNDDAIWKDIPGHYVNLWEYDSTDDTVFLTDSRGPKRNRTRINLADVYAALKTSSSYQYMVVGEYDEKKECFTNQ